MALHDQAIPIRGLRVVCPVDGRCWGYFRDDHDGRQIARRLVDSYSDEGAVAQRQKPPTVHPWETIDLGEEER